MSVRGTIEQMSIGLEMHNVLTLSRLGSYMWSLLHFRHKDIRIAEHQDDCNDDTNDNGKSDRGRNAALQGTFVR